MTVLYSCKHSGDQYRITKWIDGNPEASYLCTEAECECPAGVRESCRHREMLPYFINRPAVNTGWWLDWDRGGWVDMRTDDFDDLPQDSSVVEQPAHNGPVAGSIPAPATILPGLSQEVHTTYNYMVDGSLQIVEHKPAPYRKPRDGRRA